MALAISLPHHKRPIGKGTYSIPQRDALATPGKERDCITFGYVCEQTYLSACFSLRARSFWRVPTGDVSDLRETRPSRRLHFPEVFFGAMRAGRMRISP